MIVLTNMTTVEQLAINTIRTLSIDAVQKANSGHPGMPMGAAPMAFSLWADHMNHNPKNPEWFNRDRFVLSAGHGSMLLYSLLHLSDMIYQWMILNHSVNGDQKHQVTGIPSHGWCRCDDRSTWSRDCNGSWYGDGRTSS